MATLAQIANYEETILVALKNGGVETVEETVRIAVGKLKNHVRTAITVRLDEDFTLRIHIDGRRIYMSVSDHTVSIQSRSWRVGQRREAVAWILGYISGYRQ